MSNKLSCPNCHKINISRIAVTICSSTYRCLECDTQIVIPHSTNKYIEL